MSGDVHVRICESLGVKFPWATHPCLVMGWLGWFIKCLSSYFDLMVPFINYGKGDRFIFLVWNNREQTTVSHRGQTRVFLLLKKKDRFIFLVCECVEVK